jgi:hypothetical protein
LVGRETYRTILKPLRIPIFVNKTLQDGVEEIITQQVIEQFVKGGKVAPCFRR